MFWLFDTSKTSPWCPWSFADKPWLRGKKKVKELGVLSHPFTEELVLKHKSTFHAHVANLGLLFKMKETSAAVRLVLAV